MKTFDSIRMCGMRGAGIFQNSIKTFFFYMRNEMGGAKSCPNFNLGGGGYTGVAKTQSAKSCPNFNFQGVGGKLGWPKLKLKICLGGG